MSTDGGRSSNHDRLTEEFALARDIPPGAVRDAWLHGVTEAAWYAMGDVIRHSQTALAAARDQRWRDAVEAFEVAGEAASALRPVLGLLEAETRGRREAA